MKPVKKAFFRVKGNPQTFNPVTYELAIVKWRKKLAAYTISDAIYESHLPVMQERVRIWHKFGGRAGIERIDQFRQRLSELEELIRRRIEHPETLASSLPFELLPPGLWNFQRLILHLETRNWRIQEIVPERLEHLFALNPTKVFEGDMHRDYREYFVFLFSTDDTAILESPFHGNATYLLRKDWFTLCQKTKGELIADDRVERIIHRDIPSWRLEICRRIAKRMPGHSNDY